MGEGGGAALYVVETGGGGESCPPPRTRAPPRRATPRSSPLCKLPEVYPRTYTKLFVQHTLAKASSSPRFFWNCCWMCSCS